MLSIKNDLTTWLQYNNFSKEKGIKHFVSTRIGGNSQSLCCGLNLGFKTIDNPQTVIENRYILANSLNIPLANFVVPAQCHTDRIVVISEEDKGKGIFEKSTALPETDAMITNIAEICLMVFSADCVSILLYDPIKKVIGAAHAGWKGTVNKIAQKTAKEMTRVFGSNPKDLIVGIGPSIGSCCYEIGKEVISAVELNFTNANQLIQPTKNDKAMFNLWEANKVQLTEIGILSENIEIAELCTYCNPELFFSHRFSNGNTGRFGAGIMLL